MKNAPILALSNANFKRLAMRLGVGGSNSQAQFDIMQVVGQMAEKLDKTIIDAHAKFLANQGGNTSYSAAPRFTFVTSPDRWPAFTAGIALSSRYGSLGADTEAKLESLAFFISDAIPEFVDSKITLVALPG